MNFTTLKDELGERGFSHLSQQRLGQYVNRAYHRLNMQYRWPYRESSGTGTAPLTVADLGQIEAVTDETNDCELEESTYKDLLGWYQELSLAGNPVYWYRAYVAGSPVVATYPTSSSVTVGVQYWSVPPDMTGTDTPAVPSRYHMLLVDLAVQMAYRDSGNEQAAEALQVDIDRQTGQMVDDLISQQESRFMRVTGASDDW